jgi:TRAP-type C4-dicarboxylate transport system substrate-binding protein
VPDDWHGKMWTVFKDDAGQERAGRVRRPDQPERVAVQAGHRAGRHGPRQSGNVRHLGPGHCQDPARVFDLHGRLPDPRPDHQQKVFNGPIGEEMYKLCPKRWTSPSCRPSTWARRQVNLREARNVRTPADLKGVKLRMPGSKEWLFLGEALGATPTPLAFGEVYLGLKTGTIDGQDNPLPTVRAPSSTK